MNLVKQFSSKFTQSASVAERIDEDTFDQNSAFVLEQASRLYKTYRKYTIFWLKSIAKLNLVAIDKFTKFFFFTFLVAF